MSDTPIDAAADVCVILLTAPPGGFTYDNAAMTKIDGRESVLRCMEMYTNRPGVLQIILVAAAADSEESKRKIGSHLSFMGVKLVTGRPTWVEQMIDAQAVMKSEARHVIVHDAARPAVPYTDLDRLFAAAGQNPAVAFGHTLKGVFAISKIVPGPAELSAMTAAEVMTPALYDRTTFDAICQSGELPKQLQLIEGSTLNVRCGWNDANYVKAMIELLPKPKAKARISPFEEAQW